MNFVLLLALCFTNALAYDTEWWKHTTVYEILVQTYRDSNNDGVGDIQGIISKIDYLASIGIKTVYLTPPYKTSLKDMGYDITNYCEIDPTYGSMEDFEELVRKLKARGMKLLLDLVINHSSNEHEWFKKSIKKIPPYTDYYIWENGVNYGENNYVYPPNNWQSIFEGSSWTWNSTRKQYYYHMFLAEQPGLNLRNENVKQEVKKIIKFWLDKGVAGFRMDAPMCYMENRYLRDDIEGQTNQAESFQFMRELRKFIDEYNKEHGEFERILAPEVHGPFDVIQKYFGSNESPITHFVFNYRFEYEKHELKADEIENLIQASLSALPSNGIFGWVTQDHDQSRTGSRISVNYMDILTIMTAMLPGVFHVYYGQEIGLLDGFVQPSQYQDISGKGKRDPNRLLMQWDNSMNAGFSTSVNTFSPACMDYGFKNVEAQENQSKSHLSLLKSLISLRALKTMKFGDTQSFVLSKDVYLLWRSQPKQQTILAIFNLSNEDTTVDLLNTPLELDESDNLLVYTASTNSRYNNGDEMKNENLRHFIMEPQSAVVFLSKDISSKYSRRHHTLWEADSKYSY